MAAAYNEKKQDATPEITVEGVRATCPAASPDSLAAFREAISKRHEEIDGFLESPGFKALPFLEQEFLRIQRDGLRTVLVGANLQAELIAQTTPAPAAPEKG